MNALLLSALVLGCSRPTPPNSAAPVDVEPTAAVAPAPPVQTSVNPGINDNFLDPQLEVDKWVERFGAESREVVAQQPAILAAMGLQPGDRVADVGAGTGLYLAPLADAVGAQGKVYAVDISPRFLQHLDAMATEAGLDQVVTVEASERSSNLPDASVDAIFVCDTYHHFEYPQDTARSLYAALEPGGSLYLVDFVRGEGVSSAWILGHVRAGQDVFAEEIQTAGFSTGVPLEVGLEENYLLRFDKPE